MDQVPNLQTVNQFTRNYPAFRAGGLRWQIFNEDKNGLKEAGVILRLGRKVLIDVAKYFSWVYSQNEAAE